MTGFQDPADRQLLDQLVGQVATGSKGIDHDPGVELFEAVPTPQIEFGEARTPPEVPQITAHVLRPDIFLRSNVAQPAGAVRKASKLQACLDYPAQQPLPP